MKEFRIYLASILNPLSDKKCDYWPEGALVTQLSKKRKTDPNGHAHSQELSYQIKEIGPAASLIPKYSLQKFKEKNYVEIIDLKSALILPPFFDMHFHWVQDDVRQMPKASLLEWLSRYTWPYEAKFKNKNYSKKKAKEFFQRLIQVGTLGGACYSSLHDHALEDAMENVLGNFVIGNVLMTMNSPQYLCQTPEEAIEIIHRFSKKYRSAYAITPRFAPTTHPEVMKEAARLAKSLGKIGPFIQTHLSETPEEIEFVLSIFRKFKGFEKVASYTEIYEKCGILGKKTLMGHGIYLNEEELKILAKTQTAIIHCPTSNAPVKEGGLGSGLFNFKKIEKASIPWALGSDIGGGPFLSMFDVMRSFVNQNQKKGYLEATYTKALYRATLAGAKILGVDSKLGNLSPGKMANFIVVKRPRFLQEEKQNPEKILQALITRVRKKSHYDQLVEAVFYLGKNIFTKAPSSSNSSQGKR